MAATGASESYRSFQDFKEMLMNNTAAEKFYTPGLHVNVTHREGVDEWFISSAPLPDENPALVFKRAAEALKERGAQILNHFVWHKKEYKALAYKTWESILGETSWPVTWMIDPQGVSPFGGCTICAVSGTDVKYSLVDNRVVAAAYDTEMAEYVVLGDLRDEETTNSPAHQIQCVFDQIYECLQRYGMDFSHVMRTWFYNDRILDWYDEFNQARTAFFEKHDVFNKHVPASTGIGARNIHGSKLIASLIAAKAKDEQFSFYEVPSPLQNPALNYGSSFARALEVATPDRRHVFISGTASIDEMGATVHPENVSRQTEKTLDVVEAILKSRDMTWHNSLQGVAYIREKEDASIVRGVLAARGLSDLPILLSNNVVCREDLLFELELQAARGV